MRVIADIETNRLVNPDRIHCIVAKDIDTEERYVFRKVWPDDPEPFIKFSSGVDLWVGHNFISFDLTVLRLLINKVHIHPNSVIDTLILSRLLHFAIPGGHGLEAWGERFGISKKMDVVFDEYNEDIVERCVGDVEINERLYRFLNGKILENKDFKRAVEVEHKMAFICNWMRNDGFPFDIGKAREIYTELTEELEKLDAVLISSFPSKARFIKEIVPKERKDGSLSKVGIAWLESTQGVSPGATFSRIEWEQFDPASTKHARERLHDAGWRPVEKTKGHIEAERTRNKEKLEKFRREGWKISEKNLLTVPSWEHLELWRAKYHIRIPNEEENIKESIINVIESVKGETPENITIGIKELLKVDSLKRSMELLSKILKECLPSNTDVVKFVETQKNLWSIIVTKQDVFVDCSATFATTDYLGLKDTNYLLQTIYTRRATHRLVERLILGARVSTLEEWFAAYNEDTGCIHGTHNSIGTWPHRMSHVRPNLSTVPSKKVIKYYNPRNVEISQYWGKKLRQCWCARPKHILIGTDASGIHARILAHLTNEPLLINAFKDESVDIHDQNRTALGELCRSRDQSKTFFYSFLNGAGARKVSEILGCNLQAASESLENFFGFYPGLDRFRREQLPDDERRGYIIALDGRYLMFPKPHVILAGHLLGGEQAIMKDANLRWRKELLREKIPFKQRIINHDEWQTEVPDDEDIIKFVKEVQCKSIEDAGKELAPNCPFKGDSKHGYNWAETH